MRTLLTSLAVASVALGLTACGGGDKGGGDTPTLTVKPGQPVHIKASEYKFQPADIVLEGGGARKFEVENTGSLGHNLRVTQEGSDIGGTQTLQNGETKAATVSLQHGEYELVCSIGDHASLGMTARLTVK
jgi:plastocyanin